ncbi:MAG: ion channel [Nitrospira sp.]|nr:ion channel [Nitrospira sp.]
MTQQAPIGSVHQGGLSDRWRVYLQHRYAVLFYSLLLTLVGGPILKALGFTGNLVQVFLVLNLLAAALPAGSRKGRWILPAILLAAIILRIVSLQVGHVALSAASLVLLTLVGLYAVFGGLRFAFRSTAITSEHLYAALSAYLLVGVFLGVLYFSAMQVWPNSIIVNGEGASHQFSLANGIYFSFITLATVGYGDFVPGNDVVRGLAIVEAISGQFYLAVMIARLMSLYMSKTQ